MAAFRLWTRVERIGSNRFGAMVAAVPAKPGTSPSRFDIRRQTFSSPYVAQFALELMAQSLNDVLLARGDRITAVM